MNYITRNGIEYQNTFIDNEIIDKVKILIQELYDKKILKITNKKVYCCSCGKVDQMATANGIIDYNTQMYKIENGTPICNYCRTECKQYDEPVLVLPIYADKIKPINIVPKYLEHDYHNLIKNFLNTELQVSKTRQTGINLNLDGQNFNIDVDFTWTIFPHFLPHKEKIIVASNRNLFKMFRIDYLNNILNGEKITFVGNPYIKKTEEVDEIKLYQSIDDQLYKKLLILYNFQWTKKDSNWEPTVGSYFRKLRHTGRE